MSCPAYILYDNAADRASISVPDTAAGLGAENLKTDIKGQVCRVIGGAATITLSWPSQETVGGVVLPASNLGPSSTIRVRAYRGVELRYDSGDQWAAPGGILRNWGFDQSLNVNDFAFNFPPITALYFPEHEAITSLVVSLYDPATTFIDISRLVVGRVLRTEYGAAWGQSDGIMDMSVNSRAASGDIKTDLGPKARRLSFTLSAIIERDRAQVRQILNRGIGKFLFVSLLPESEDPELERDKSIYGKVTQPGMMSWINAPVHSASFDIEGF